METKDSEEAAVLEPLNPAGADSAGGLTVSSEASTGGAPSGGRFNVQKVESPRLPHTGAAPGGEESGEGEVVGVEDVVGTDGGGQDLDNNNGEPHIEISMEDIAAALKRE